MHSVNVTYQIAHMFDFLKAFDRWQQGLNTLSNLNQYMISMPLQLVTSLSQVSSNGSVEVFFMFLKQYAHGSNPTLGKHFLSNEGLLECNLVHRCVPGMHMDT